MKKNDLNLTEKKLKLLTNSNTWEERKKLLEYAEILLNEVGSEIFNDYNLFKVKINEVIKTRGIKITISQKIKY